MKLFGTLLAVGLSQKYKPTTPGPIPCGDDERWDGTRCVPPINIYGDPHFVVHTAGQDPICFDFQPLGGTLMNLLIDPESLLSVSATMDDRGNGRSFMNSIHFASPGGARLEFDVDGIHLAGKQMLNRVVRSIEEFEGVQSYGDISFVQKWDEEQMHEHTKIRIENGPVFMIKGNVKKKSLGFAVLDTNGISQKSRGIAGQFIRDNSYTVVPTDTIDDLQFGSVNAGGMNISALWSEFHSEKSCWVLDQDKVSDVIEDI